MLARKDVTEMFSAFAQLEADRFSRWLIDARLRRSIQNCLSRSPEVANSENFWALYWYKRWQTSEIGLAKMHLSAYLQESLYWASEKAVAKYTNIQFGVADYFQMANAEVETILKDFNAERSSNLKYYAVMAMTSRLRDLLRQRKEVDICTNWALLRKVRTKTVLEALSQAGLSAKEIAQYRLAWTCFKELYVHQSSGTKRLPEPNRQLWSAITDLYNREQLAQLGFDSGQCTSEKIEQWLTQTALHIRAYLFPPVSSLNILKPDSETADILADTLDLADPSKDSLLADMISKEDVQDRKKQAMQMSAVLSNALKLLDVPSQEALRLYYQEGLTQQQIMQQLQMSQSTVSRRLVKGREALLAALVKWRQDSSVNISANCNQVKDMSIALEEYLKNSYGQFSKE